MAKCKKEKDILLQNTLVRAQAIKLKKSQFYFLFDYST